MRLLGLILLLNAGNSSAYVIERKGDELLLPPYLRKVEGGILNVISERTSDQKNNRSAHAGEWLDYGDQFSTPDRMGIYVQMNEGLQWVGGGVFQGKIVSGKWNPKNPTFEMEMNRGWMKVWAKPSSFSGALQIKTPKVTLVVNEGVFWVMANALKTEVYVLSGTVKDDDHLNVAEKFYEWSGSPSKLQKTSAEWDFVSLENRISKLYPNLVKLSHRANEDWLDDTSAKKYSELRSKGWKKSDRYFPTPTPKK
jgi:hypothetical protein